MIIPSIGSANQLKIYEELNRFVSKQPIHIDIEDGNFVPNITFGLKTVEQIAKTWKGPLDAHLLVTNPAFYIKPLADFGIARIAFHIEAAEYPLEIIERIKKLGMKSGLAFNFKTDLLQLKMFAEEIDYVIIMTSEPDYSDLKFRASACNRIKNVCKMLDRSKEIWADGGITADCLSDVRKAGADTAIVGRGVFNGVNPKEELVIMNQLFDRNYNEKRKKTPRLIDPIIRS